MAKTDVGEFLAALRKSKGYTQAEAAELLGVSNKTVSNWETGASSPDISMLPALAELYGVTCDEIARGRRIAPAEDERTREIKREKAMRRLLEKHRTALAATCWICGGMTAVGILLALAIGCAALESLIGFFVGLLPIAASVVTAAVLTQRIRFAVGDEAEDAGAAALVASARRALGILLVANAAAFGFILPHAFAPVHAGLELGPALGYGLGVAALCAIVAVLIWAAAAAAKRNALQRKAAAEGCSPTPAQVLARRRTKFCLWMFLLPSAICLAAIFILFFLGASVTFPDVPIATSLHFDTAEEMIAFAERSDLFSEYAHELVSEDLPQTADEEGRYAAVYRFAEFPAEQEAPYRCQRTADGTLVTVYRYRAAEVDDRGERIRILEFTAFNPELQGGVENISAIAMPDGSEEGGSYQFYCTDLSWQAQQNRAAALRASLYGCAGGVGILYLLWLAAGIPIYLVQDKKFRKKQAAEAAGRQTAPPQD